MRILLAALFIGALIFSLSLPFFYDKEGYLTPLSVLPLAGLSAAGILLAAWPTAWRKAAGWFSLYILGQAVSLQLIDAGTRVHYQHYRLSQGDGGTADLIFLGLIVVEAFIVLFALIPRQSVITSWIRRNIGFFMAVSVLLTTIFLATFPSEPFTNFAWDLAISSLVIITQLACLVLGLLAIPTTELATWGERINRFAEGPDETSRQGFRLAGIGIDRLAIVCAAWVTMITIALSILSYERHPHIADEFAYLFQARYFAEGKLGVPVPPVPEAVDAYLMDCNDIRCSSPVPPGWPAVLAVGVKLGAPWLMNPVLSGINALLLFALLHLVYSRKAARLGVLLLSFSPWYLLLGMSFMNHMFSLTCTLIAALSVALMHRSKRLAWALPGGLSIGLLSLTRPLEGLMVASVLGLASLFISGRWYRQGPAIALGLATLAVAIWVLPYNQAMTGEATRFPIMAYADKVLGPGVNSLGFGPEKGVEWGGMDPFPGHGLPDVIVNAILNLDGMNIELFGWSVGSLLLILMLFTLRSDGRYISRFSITDRWMLLFIGMIFALQSLYWFSGGPDFAARYYFQIILPLLALTVSAIDFLSRALERTAPFTFRQAQAVVLTAVAVMSFSSITTFLPWRAIDKYHHYRGMRPDVRALIAAHDFSQSIILVNAANQPDLISAMVYSSLDPSGPGPLIFWNRDPGVKQRLLSAYQDRTVWILDSPSITGGGYRVVQGPVSAKDLL